MLRAPLGRRGFREKRLAGETQEICCEILGHPHTLLRCVRPVPRTLGCLTSLTCYMGLLSAGLFPFGLETLFGELCV